MGTESSALSERLQHALGPAYRVERELGGGGMSRVFLAEDTRLGRPIVVKLLHPDMSAELSARRFEREIAVAARLQHPHVLALLGVGELDGLPFYTMPFVRGETLRQRVRTAGALPIAEALRLLRELADALAYAHAQGVVHRDLKPENVLLSEGHALVADFGIAKALRAATHDGSAAPHDTLTATGIAVGTPAYMAPEQAVGDVATDHRADLYALGVIAYELLTGRHPFEGLSPRALAAAHLTETPDSPATHRADVPPALAMLVMQLLAKDPADRPPNAAAVIRALDDVRIEPPRRATARRWRVIAAALLLAAVGAAGYAVRGRGRGRAIGAASAAAATSAATHAVAVLPFVNTSGDPQDDYFSDGLTDELAYALGRLPGLHLAGRTSSYAFKGKAVAAQDVGRALGVDAFIDGTVRRTGERMRVTAQLVSTTDGTVRWDSVYETRSRDVFAVQDAFTRAIAAALAPALGARSASGGTDRAADAARGTTDQEAYDLYLKGRYNFLLRNPARLVRAVDYYKQAIARDPGFARAHAGLALAYEVLPIYFPDPTDSATPLALASARRAVALDSTLGDAQFALAEAFQLKLRFGEAVAHYRVGLTHDPTSVTGHHWLATTLLILGRSDEALVELRLATQLDPLAHSAAGLLAGALLDARRFPDAVAAARHALAIDSTFWGAIWPLGLAQAFDGQPDSAVRTLEAAVRQHPQQSHLGAALLFAYAAAGRWGDAARLRRQLHAPGGDASGGSDGAIADMVFGDREPLVRILTSAAGQRRFIAAGGWFGCNPMLDPLWTDVRFRDAMRTLGVQTCTRARPWPIGSPPGASPQR